MKSPTLSRVETDRILERVKNGESVYDISAELGRWPANVYGILKRRYGFEFKERNSYWPQRLFLPEDPTVHAYLAGLIDGEGSLKRRRDGLWSVVVVMTHEPVIRWLAEFGGNFGIYERPALEGRKTTFRWQVARRADVLHVLRATLPYLIVKREVAECAIVELEERITRGFQRSIHD